MNYTLDINCHNYVSKGTYGLRMRLNLNGLTDFIPLKERIKVEHYDIENQEVKRGIKGATQYQTFITRERQRIIDIIKSLLNRDVIVTHDKVKAEYRKQTHKDVDISPKKSDFKTFVEEKIKLQREKKELEESTLCYYERQLNRLLRDFQPKISIHELDHDLIQRVKDWMEKEDMKKNSRHHILQFLKKYSGYLYDERRLEIDPFQRHKVSSIEATEPDFLLPEEISTLQELYDSKGLLASDGNIEERYRAEKLHNVLQQCLIAIYCGLRISDMSTLSIDDIKDDSIVKKMKKGRLGVHRTVSIPIHHQLRAMMEFDREDKRLFSMKMYQSSTTNRHLNTILKKAGIVKRLSFHKLRHTFAINSLLLGIPIEVVGALLGHVKMESTQKYARIIDRLRKKHIIKWDYLNLEVMKIGNRKLHCTSCSWPVLEYHPDIVTHGKLEIQCPKCSESFTHDFGQERLMKVVN